MLWQLVQTNDRAAVKPLLETTAMELNNSDGGAVSEDFPAANADMQDRDDSDLSASVLQKISDMSPDRCR